tara:strand:- start:304 stop:525 length:222 start_codon:yes stop_codon:yes gene_type:complete
MSNPENTEQTKTETVYSNYARAAILLLAANFMLTGYVMASLMKIQEVTTSTDSAKVTVVPVITDTPAEEELAQ